MVMGIAGVFFGLLVGWIIGTQQQPAARGALAAAPAAAQQAGPGAPAAAPPLDEARASAMKTTAQQNPNDAVTRVQLGNMYFDAERYSEAAQWYDQALRINPKDVNVSTDLGISYYYMNDADRALAQFEHSLQIDPKHAKTMLNIGIVRAFGKSDLKGAAEVWQRVIDLAPGSEEARAARQALDGVRANHPDVAAPSGKGPGPS
jgi:cytochrome c-type biogenesis protein CcmH/NrfG